MKNDMRQSVDRAFAGATWDEAHARRVISRIEERKQPVMKRKLTVALVCALVLVLASACALAAVFVQRSERSNVVLTARNALTRQCRFTPGMLALFRADAQKNAGGDYTVTFTTNEGIPGTLLGVYSVHVNGSTAVANWSYDGHAGDMDHWDASIIGSLSGGGCGICDEGSLVRTVSSIYAAGAFHGQGSDDAHAYALYAAYPAPAQGGRSTL